MYRGAEVIIAAAYAHGRIIGTDEGIPWKQDLDCQELVTEDIKRLRKLIQGSSVIVGRKTYEEICQVPSDPIEQKWSAEVLVLSRNPRFYPRHRCATVCHTLGKALDFASQEKIVIFGGAEVYNTVLERGDLVDRIELTTIEKVFQTKKVTVKFPEFPLHTWQMTSYEENMTSAGVRYRFLQYGRR